jgi:hypothetical protein
VARTRVAADPLTALIAAALVIQSQCYQNCIILKPKGMRMAKGEQKGNREARKPKKEKIKTIAAAPSQKTAGWQPSFGSGKKK